METEKYYTPKITEFYEGFEFEFLDKSGPLVANAIIKKEWKKDSIDWHWLDIIFDDYEHNPETISENYRVKFLDKEDIEEIGFIKRKLPTEPKYETNYEGVIPYKNDRTTALGVGDTLAHTLKKLVAR